MTNNHERGATAETNAVPAWEAGVPAATGNLNPWTEATAHTDNPDPGPLLIISGSGKESVPCAIANALCRQQEDNNDGVAEIVEINDCGQALTIDNGWRESTWPSPSSSVPVQ